MNAPIHKAGQAYKAGKGAASGAVDADPVTTEIIRHSLNSAANQMKSALVRTAFSQVIYEVLDFAVALYDREIRMLAQAPSLPAFMGTLSFCVEGAIEGVGGEDKLEPGDIVLYNVPYGAGSHAQDAALVMPVFLGTGELVGYSAIKAHWLDIGGKEPYSTDTVDVFQEGTMYPGIKLYRRGERVEDIFRMVLANSRVPKAVSGDIRAQVTGVRIGAEGLVRIVERYGTEKFNAAVERMYDHGEAVVRNYLSKIPDGRYVGSGMLDNDGINDDPVPFEVAVEIDGATARVDFSNAPDAVEGPMNSPLPRTVSAARIALSMLAGGHEAPTEGHFRPIEVVTRPGSIFHALPPSPIFLCGRIAMQAIEVIYEAIAKVVPELVPAWSGSDLCALVWWGKREATGEPWTDGSPHAVGAGGHIGGDGATLMHIGQSSTRVSPTEVWEAKNPWLLQKIELAQDSCGAGRHRGGLGIDMRYHMLEDVWLTSAVERTKTPAWGLSGGTEGRPNGVVVHTPDGRAERFGKFTRLKLPKGSTLELNCGGGGGFGPPEERPIEAVLTDVREGYLSEANARKFYPHAFASPDAAAAE
ncbi:MAG: hydantoinase B/oxoprolinase family protein [Proteobacteria bacterium]|nr:hydantoinase B/oxoprolinase family protein [Pseudomonadota bacterium]